MPNKELRASTTSFVYPTVISNIIDDGSEYLKIRNLYKKPVEIHLNVETGPIYCTGYGIQSANWPDRRHDVRKWVFKAYNRKTGEVKIIHNNNSQRHRERSEWYDVKVKVPFPATFFTLELKEINDDINDPLKWEVNTFFIGKIRLFKAY